MNDLSLASGTALLVHFKKTDPKAVTPTRAHEGDAGLDLTSIGVKRTNDYAEHEIGIAVEIPPGYFGLITPRSSQSNYQQILANNVGIIDESYRGPITVRFRTVPKVDVHEFDWINREYNVGDRVAQLIILPCPKVVLMETTELTQTERGAGGYGSTGR